MYGFPVTTANGEYTIVQGLPIDDFSREKMNATLKELEEERAGVAALLGEHATCQRDCDDADVRRRARRFRRGRRAPSGRCRCPARSTPITRSSRRRSGFQAIYLSGGGVAAGSLGLPDLGISNLDDVLTDVRRITDVCALPLLVDVDTGFGASAFNIARTVKSLIKFGAAAMHIEDQVGAKRCGHRPGQGDRRRRTRWSTASRRRSTRGPIRTSSIMARTDALAVEGLEAAIERALRLRRGRRRHDLPRGDHRPRDVQDVRRRGEGADPRQHHRVRRDAAVHASTSCASADVAIALYPLSAFRAMNQAALDVYRTLRRDGTQKAVVDTMQTRAELYEYLGYHAYEQKLDALFAEPGSERRQRCAAAGGPMTDARRRAQAEEIGRAVRRRRRQHGAVHRRPHRQRPALPRLRHPRHRRRLRVRGDRLPAVHGKLPNVAGARGYKTKLEVAARPAGRRCRTSLERSRPARIRWTCMRTGVSALGCVLPEKDDHSVAGRARHRRPADGLVRLDAALLVSLEPQRQAHRRRDRRRFDRRAFPAPAARPQAAGAVGAARCTRRSTSTPSTSSTPRRSPRA